ncbi:ABC transporter ATP-binding protein [Hafnia alvei]|uniref:Energy-coupling factor transport system ATP-binding protein n=1 Tax=Hafnia alvei TaxID=569 RepID=A0A1C6Z5W9_HAFAL|nr:ABC transporter ATP-binding protein [Hafnia alvei]NLS53798.1 ATP-binding cassette domain-containing protein [Hafnia alvei]SCM54455.1 energy-coupling factor transport system ATP-binding protein [Hafnia alvei]
MLNIENMGFSWEAEKDCLQGVNLHIKRGEQWVITGENGAGKSTLLRLAAGLLKPSRGSVYLDGVDLAQMKSLEKAAQIGFLFQEVERQLFHSSVLDEIRFGLRLQRLPSALIEARAQNALETCGLIAVANKHPLDLHSGQRRMVAVACLCAMQSPLLLLDEPSRDFDPYWMGVFDAWLKKRREQGTTVLAISHDPEFSQRHFKRTILVNEGTARIAI